MIPLSPSQLLGWLHVCSSMAYRLPPSGRFHPPDPPRWALLAAAASPSPTASAVAAGCCLRASKDRLNRGVPHIDHGNEKQFKDWANHSSQSGNISHKILKNEFHVQKIAHAFLQLVQRTC